MTVRESREAAQAAIVAHGITVGLHVTTGAYELRLPDLLAPRTPAHAHGVLIGLLLGFAVSESRRA